MEAHCSVSPKPVRRRSTARAGAETWKKETKPNGLPCSLAITLLALAVLSAQSQAASVFLEPGKNAADYRNVALNPTASTNRGPASYPHATSNSEYNQREFAARNAIDGNRRNDDVHGCGSWGPQKEPGIWWRLDFGRPVNIDKLVLFLRAAWTPDNAPHDSYWTEATVEFSDGSVEKLEMRKIASGQEFRLTQRTVTWLTLRNLKPAEDKWCALAEFEAWGHDAFQFAYIADAAFAAKLREDALVAKALHAMLGFQRASWEQGVAGQALIEAGEQEAAIALARASLVHVNRSGVVAAWDGSPTDPVMLGDTLWWAAQLTGEPNLRKAADDMLQFALTGAVRAPDASQRRSVGFAISIRSARDSAFTSFGSTRIPAPGGTVSGMAPPVVPTTGRPCAKASAKAMP